jgi:hypothetical protein
MNEFTTTAHFQGPQDLTMDPDCGAVISDGHSGVDFCKRSTYGLNYALLFPGTKWAPEKLPTIQIQGLTTLDLGPYPGRTSDWIFTYGDNVTKVIHNHTVKFGMLIEHSGQNDRIQFTTATPPSTNNQNGSFRFFDTGHPTSTGFAPANTLLGYFSDYSEFGDKPVTHVCCYGLGLLCAGQLEGHRKLTVEAGVRYSMWPPWSSRWGTLATFDPRYYDSTKAAVIDRTGGFVVSGDRYNGMVLPGCKPQKDATDRFPFLSQFDRLYHCLPDGFAPTYKNGFSAKGRCRVLVEQQNRDPIRHRNVFESQPDQQFRSLGWPGAADGTANRHQRNRGYAYRRCPARLSSYRIHAGSGLPDSNCMDLEYDRRTGNSRQARGSRRATSAAAAITIRGFVT